MCICVCVCACVCVCVCMCLCLCVVLLVHEFVCASAHVRMRASLQCVNKDIISAQKHTCAVSISTVATQPDTAADAAATIFGEAAVAACDASDDNGGGDGEAGNGGAAVSTALGEKGAAAGSFFSECELWSGGTTGGAALAISGAIITEHR